MPGIAQNRYPRQLGDSQPRTPLLDAIDATRVKVDHAKGRCSDDGSQSADRQVLEQVWSPPAAMTATAATPIVGVLAPAASDGVRDCAGADGKALKKSSRQIGSAQPPSPGSDRHGF